MRDTIGSLFNNNSSTSPAWNPSFYLCDNTENLLSKIENASTHTPSINDPETQATEANSCSPTPSTSNTNHSRVLLYSHLNIKREIGSGHLAKVYLAEHVLNKELFAIKAIDKKLIMTETRTRHVHDEKDMLMMVNHPFLVKLWGTFQTASHLCLVTEYVAGGELFNLLKRKKLSEDQVKFFAAEIVLALEYLHNLDIVYRDLKPENVILDSKGHIKLVDFGFAKVLKEPALTLCGTPDYLAPEIIRARGYTKDVDWWSLGVLIYEMIIGVTPFYAETPLELYENILLCDINWMCDMTPEAKDLIQGLLQTKAKDRFCLQDIKDHPWFSTVNFDQLSKLAMDPPFIPEEADTSFCYDQETKHLYDTLHELDDRFVSF